MSSASAPPPAPEVCASATMKSFCSTANATFSVRQPALRRWSPSSFLGGSSAGLAMSDRDLTASLALDSPNRVVPSSPRRSFKVFSMSSSYGSSPPRRNYRREPRPSMSELDLEEEVSRIDMDPAKMMQNGDPDSHQAIIKDVMPVGYFVTLPSGRDGYLPAQDLGFTGGLAILRKLFQEGQEITVRIVCRGGAGREIVSVKKPEFAPPSEQKTIESMRLHFENEKKNQGRPRRRR